jgi:hypothetical protein
MMKPIEDIGSNAKNQNPEVSKAVMSIKQTYDHGAATRMPRTTLKISAHLAIFFMRLTFQMNLPDYAPSGE